MKKTRALFEEYLRRINCLAPVGLGSNAKASISQEDNDRFVRRLEGELRFDRHLVLLYVSMLCLVFILAIVLFFYYLDSVEKVATAFGGSFLGIVLIVEKLRRLWWQRSVLNITLLLVKDLPPQESVRVVQTLYWRMLHK